LSWKFISIFLFILRFEKLASKISKRVTIASEVDADVPKEMSMQRQFPKKTSILIIIRYLPTIKKKKG